MKNVILPINQDDAIDLSQITNSFEGIIICYREGMAVGHIICERSDDEEPAWSFHSTISTLDTDDWEYNLYDLIENLRDEDTIDSCKVIEYGEE